MYNIHPHHRNWIPNKSQWTITEEQEEACFDTTHTNGWIESNKGWGLHLENSRAQYLGLCRSHQKQLVIAKFVESPADSWHGYPADHMNNIHDIPSTRILKQWIAGKQLTPAKIRKISRGQPCNL